MLDIIAGVILLAFGLLVLYFSAEFSKTDEAYFLALLIGIACVIAGGWILLSTIPLALILKRIAGLVLAGVGVFIITGFPDVTPDYQPREMSKAGLLIGLILFILGLYLMFV
jgi:hypothetical protein